MNPQPWYTSAVFVSALVNGVVKVALLFGVTIMPDKLNNAITAVVLVVSIAIEAYTAHKRAQSDVSPLTVSRKSADAQTTAITQAATDLTAIQSVNPGDSNAKVSVKISDASVTHDISTPH